MVSKEKILFEYVRVCTVCIFVGKIISIVATKCDGFFHFFPFSFPVFALPFSSSSSSSTNWNYNVQMAGNLFNWKKLLFQISLNWFCWCVQLYLVNIHMHIHQAVYCVVSMLLYLLKEREKWYPFALSSKYHLQFRNSIAMSDSSLVRFMHSALYIILKIAYKILSAHKTHTHSLNTN